MNEELPDPAREAGTSSPQSAEGAVGKISYPAGELFGEATEIIIKLDELEYRLRITSKGKLILTK